eukprot:UN03220
MHSKKVNQLMNILDAASDYNMPPPISNHSTPYSSLSPRQNVTDLSHSVDCDDYNKPQKETIIKKLQYKISVEPIYIPHLSLNWSLSMSSSFPDSTLGSTKSTPSLSSSIIEEINPIQFDIDCGTYMMSSDGLHSGCHEWSFKVLTSDMCRLEIGIVSTLAPKVNISDNDGIRDNNKFGARAVYGNIMEIKS